MNDEPGDVGATVIPDGLSSHSRFQACSGPGLHRVHICDMETAETSRTTLCRSTGISAIVRGRIDFAALCPRCTKITMEIVRASGAVPEMTAELIGVSEIC